MRVLHKTHPRKRIMSTGKKLVVPNATMSLHEMLRRFVRREQLPVEKAGSYFESDYDLEKVSKMDRVDQEEILSEMKQKTATAKKKAQTEYQRLEKERKDKEDLLKQSDPKPDPSAPKG